MKTFIASFLATLRVRTFSVSVGELGETVVIKDDVVTYENGTPVEGSMQIIQRNIGKVQTAICTIYFVIK